MDVGVMRRWETRGLRLRLFCAFYMYVYLQLIKKGFYISYFLFRVRVRLFFFFFLLWRKSGEYDARVQHAAYCRTSDGACHYFRLVHNGSFLGYIFRNAEIDSIVLPTSRGACLDYHISSRNPAQKIAYLFRGQNGGQNGEISLAKVKLHYILLDKTATQIKRYYHIEIVC